MLPTKQLIQNLRNEYLKVASDIDKATFALITLPFDECETCLLNQQIEAMETYAEMLLNRAIYATTKD